MKLKTSRGEEKGVDGNKGETSVESNRWNEFSTNSPYYSIHKIYVFLPVVKKKNLIKFTTSKFNFKIKQYCQLVFILKCRDPIRKL